MDKDVRPAVAFYREASGNELVKEWLRSLDRLLDPDNASVTLQTIGRVARALGKRLVFSLEDARKKRSAA